MEIALRWGVTTGTCAAAATKGAMVLLLLGQKPKRVLLETPKGISVTLAIGNYEMQETKAMACVQKYSGDDPDVTNGILIQATVEKIEEGIVIDGGEGVGRVTKRGLEQPVGAAAINAVPRQMIGQAVEEISQLAEYTGGIAVTISAIGGAEIAKKTYNPKLGIVGGISILGTSGIVEPMSEQALLDSIKVELRMKAVNSNGILVLTPGNYGSRFLERTYGMSLEDAVKVSNFIGEALDFVKTLPIQHIVLVGHIGKLVKVAGGIFQTHSKYADGRREILGVHGAMAGADRETVCRIMETITTEEALQVLEEKGLLEKTMATILKSLQEKIQSRLGEEIQGEAILFSEQLGKLGETEGAVACIEAWRRGEN